MALSPSKMVCAVSEGVPTKMWRTGDRSGSDTTKTNVDITVGNGVFLTVLNTTDAIPYDITLYPEANEAINVEWKYAADRYGYAFDGWYAMTQAKAEEYPLPARDPSAYTVFVSKDAKLPVSTIAANSSVGWVLTHESAQTRYDMCFLKAKFVRVMTVTFNANGGSVAEATRDVKSGAAVGELPRATREGTGYSYSFAGWWTAKTGGTQVDENTEITADVTFYARWTAIPNDYEVSFDRRGGTGGVTSKIVTYGLEYGTLPAPTMDNHNFAGWNTEAGGGGATVTADTIVTTADDHILYAQWANITSVLTFDARGGSGTMPTGLVATMGRQLPDGAVIPALAGYRFLGFFDAQSGGTMYYNSLGESARAWDKDVGTAPLYAQWERYPYIMIGFDPGIGAFANAETGMRFRSVVANAPIGELPEVGELDGRTFIAWEHDGMAVTAETTFGEPTTVGAHWSLGITYDFAGGEVTDGDGESGEEDEEEIPEWMTVDADNRVTLPPTPSRTGYIFEGYTLDKDVKFSSGATVVVGTKIPAETTITLLEDTVATAKWRAKIVTIKFYSVTYGSIPDQDNPSHVMRGEFGRPYAEIMDSSGNVGLPSIIVAYGSVSSGWRNSGGMTVTGSTIITDDQDHSLIATSYTYMNETTPVGALLRFHPEGAKAWNGCLYEEFKQAGEKVSSAFPATNPTRTGHKFVHWAYEDDDPDATTADYVDSGADYVISGGQSGYNKEPDNMGVIDIYADWYAVRWNLQIARNDGTYDTVLSSVTDGATALVGGGVFASDNQLLQQEEYRLLTLEQLGWTRPGYSMTWKPLYTAEVTDVEDGGVVSSLTLCPNATLDTSDASNRLRATWTQHVNTVTLVVVDADTGEAITEITDAADVIEDGVPTGGTASGLTMTFNGDPTVEFQFEDGITVGEGSNARVMRLKSVGTSTDGFLEVDDSGVAEPYEVKVDRAVTCTLMYKYAPEPYSASVGYVTGDTPAIGLASVNGKPAKVGHLESVPVGEFEEVRYSASAASGYVFDGWYEDADGATLYSSADEFTLLATESIALYAKFLPDSRRIYEWEGGAANKTLEWRSKVYVADRPFNPVSARVDALGYNGDGRGTTLRLEVGMHSSPDSGPTAVAALDNIRSQDARRLPRLRAERFMQIAVTANVEVDALLVGTSMGGLAV